MAEGGGDSDDGYRSLPTTMDDMPRKLEERCRRQDEHGNHQDGDGGDDDHPARLDMPPRDNAGHGDQPPHDEGCSRATTTTGATTTSAV